MQEYHQERGSSGAVGRKTIRQAAKRGGGENPSRQSVTSTTTPVVEQLPLTCASSRRKRPALLMLSHCVPDPMGTADRARAWQMLRLASQTHDVHLACIKDEPVHLNQWRQVHSQTHTIVVEASPWRRETMGRGLSLIAPNVSDQVRMTSALRRQVRMMRKDHRYDAVMCMHPGLWHLAERVRANVRVCDLYQPMSLAHAMIARQSNSYARQLWHNHRAHQRAEVEQYIACRADILTVNSTLAQHNFIDRHCHSLVVPDAVDLGYFKLPLSAMQHEAPQVVLHGNWRSRSFWRAKGWFTDEIWPRIKQAVPHAVLTFSGPALSWATVHRLGSASVVVSSLPEISQAVWPTLQAMAMARPVIASSDTICDLGVKHGEHLLMPKLDRDWVDLCVDSLRNTAMRLQLARGARNFIQQHCPIKTTGMELSYVMARRISDVPLYAQAA